MADIDLRITADSSRAAAAIRDVTAAAQRAGASVSAINRAAGEATERNLKLYREETRILDMRARGRNDIADALRAEVDLRRAGMRLERELHVSEQEGLALARRRLALEREIAGQAARRGGGQGGAGGPGGGGPPRGGGPPPPGGPNRGQDANDAYNIAQDLIQGGPAAIANQAPQIIRLLRQYKKTAVGVGAAASASLAVASYLYMREQIDEDDESSIGRRRIQNSLVNRSKAWNRARTKLRDDATTAGIEESESHIRISRDQAAAAPYRAARAGVADSAAEERYRNARAALSSVKDPVEQIRQIADLDKEFEAERHRMAQLALSDELRLATIEGTTAQRRKEDIAAILALEEKRIALGRMATDQEIKAVAAAKAETAGLDARLKASQARISDLEQRSKVFNLESSTLRPLQIAGMDEQRDREIKAATDEIITQGVAAFKALRKSAADFTDDVLAKSARISAARKDQDQEAQIMELRSRGKGRAADKLQKEADISREAKALEDGPGKRSPEEARRMAEQQYDMTHRVPGRIRGAGRQISDRPSDEPGGLDALARLNSRNRRVGDGPSGPTYSGLDGLDELQKKNQRVRGAGFKGARASADSEASGGEAKPSGGGPLAVILGALGTIAKKLDSIDRGSRRISR